MAEARGGRGGAGRLMPAMTVADIGAGTGYFAARIAKRVPEGKVFAADMGQDMVRYLGQRAEREHLPNLVAGAGGGGLRRPPRARGPYPCGGHLPSHRQPERNISPSCKARCVPAADSSSSTSKRIRRTARPLQHHWGNAAGKGRRGACRGGIWVGGDADDPSAAVFPRFPEAGLVNPIGRENPRVRPEKCETVFR